MLNPNYDRLDYGKVLAPSEGFSLDFAVGTTYSLDLDALVGACLALGLSEETDSELMKNPVYILNALRACADKVALFCEAGQIYMPDKVTPLYILIEKIVFQMNTNKRKGIAKYPSFHPKFWLLRYVDKNNQPFYRVVVLSRNLTFDRSWDITFCMYGRVKEEETPKTAPIIDFIKHILNNSSIDATKKKKISALNRELQYVYFELNSREFEDFEFLPTGIKNNSVGFHSTNDAGFYPLFRDHFNELLVMSPFLTGSVIKAFNDRSPDKESCMLITRAMSLSKLKPEDCSAFRIFTVKDAVVDGKSAISEENSDIHKQDIHAKLYMVRKNFDSYLYLGSLNASYNAINENVEFMIRLKSKKRYLNLSRLSEDLFCGAEADPNNPFWEVKLDSSTAVDEEEERQSELEGYIKEINRMKPEAMVSEGEEGYNLSISFPLYKQSEYNVSISPLLSNKTEVFAPTMKFTSLQLIQLSEFYRVSVGDGQRTVQRVIIIPTKGLPEDREKAVVNSVVKDKECFCRYIAFLLEDNHIPGIVETNYTMGGSGFGKTGKSVLMPALYEKMLKTAVAAPENFKEIDYLLQAISSDDVIPEEFEELYNSFKKVVKY